METKKKPARLSDVRNLPKWQKYAIISMLFILAAAFTVSGVMIVVIGGLIEDRESGQGEVDGKTIRVDDLRARMEFIRTALMRSQLLDDSLDELFPQIPFVDPDGGYITQAYFPWYIMSRALAYDDVATMDAAWDKSLPRAAWIQMILAAEARDDGMVVVEQESRRVAMDLLLGPVDATEVERTAGESSESFRERGLAFEQERAATYQAELANAGSNERFPWRFTPAMFEEIVAEAMLVTKYVNTLMAKSEAIPNTEILDSYLTPETPLKGDFVRVHPEHPEVTRRVEARLAHERAVGAARREILRMVGIADPSLVFQDPVTRTLRAAIANAEESQVANDYNPTRYRFVMILGLLSEMEDRIPYSREHLVQAYDKYKRTLFNRDLPEDELESRVDAAQAEARAEHGEDWVPSGFTAQIDSERNRLVAAHADTGYTEEELEAQRTWAREQWMTEHRPAPQSNPQTEPADEEEADSVDEEWEPTAEELEAREAYVEAHIASLQEEDQDWQPVGGWDSWAAEKAWEMWRIDETERQRYRPLSDPDVRRDCVRIVRQGTLNRVTRELFLGMRDEINDRVYQSIPDPNSDRGRTWQLQRRERLQTERDQINNLREFYLGTNDASWTGLKGALESLRQRLDQEMVAFRNRVSLSGDPSDGVETGAAVRTVRDGLQALRSNLGGNARETFLRQARLGQTAVSDMENLLARWSREIQGLEDTIARRNESPLTTNEMDMRALEEVRLARLRETVAEIAQMRRAWMALFAQWDAVLDDGYRFFEYWAPMEVPGSENDATLPSDDTEQPQGERVSLPFLGSWVDSLEAQLTQVIRDTEAATNLQGRIGEVLSAYREAERAAEQFRRQMEITARDMRETLPPDRLIDLLVDRDALPARLRPSGAGIRIVHVGDDREYDGMSMDGVGGESGVPAFAVEVGLTREEIEELPLFKEQLPFLLDAAEYSTTNNNFNMGENLFKVLDTLTPGAYSQVMGVENRCYMMLQLLERTETPAPVVSEPSAYEQAREEYMDTLRSEAAREIAQEVHAALTARLTTIRQLPVNDVLGEVERNRPNLGTEAPVREWLTVLRNADASLANRMNAATQARYALADAAVRQVAESYDPPLPIVTTDWFHLGDDIPEVTLVESKDDKFAKEIASLVPRVSVGMLLIETFQKEPGSPDTWQGYMVPRCLEVGTPSGWSEERLVEEMSLSQLQLMRRRLRQGRFLANPDLLDRFHLTRLIESVNARHGGSQRVRIDYIEPRESNNNR